MSDGPFVRAAKRMLSAAYVFDDVLPVVNTEVDPLKREDYIARVAKITGQPHEFVRKCLGWYELNST